MHFNKNRTNNLKNIYQTLGNSLPILEQPTTEISMAWAFWFMS